MWIVSTAPSRSSETSGSDLVEMMVIELPGMISIGRVAATEVSGFEEVSDGWAKK